MLEFKATQTDDELQGVLDLQKRNFFGSISAEEAKKEGFVTVEHDFELLKRMNDPFGHVIAKNVEEVVAYALVMLQNMKLEIPVLVPMFQQLDKIVYKQSLLKNLNYFVIGQICVDKSCRGKGVFRGLYDEMTKRMKDHFDFMVTEIDARNQRSINAHLKYGFEIIKKFSSDDGKDWVIVLLEIKN